MTTRATSLPWRQALAVLAIALLLLLAWRNWPALAGIFGNIERAHAWLQDLGPLGPLVLIALNTLQIVIAPIPGYFVQAAAGWAFGLWAGALYGTIGLALGAAVAATLTHWLGRPFVHTVVGSERLQQWEHWTHTDSPWLWAGLLLAPVGDLPYFLAGLSRFSIPRLALLTVFVRGPSVVVASAVGAGIISLTPQLLALLFVALLAALLLLYRYGEALQRRMDRLSQALWRWAGAAVQRRQ